MPTRPRLCRVGTGVAALASGVLCAQLAWPAPISANPLAPESLADAAARGSLKVAAEPPPEPALAAAPSPRDGLPDTRARELLDIPLRGQRAPTPLGAGSSGWVNASLAGADLSDPKVVLTLIGCDPSLVRFHGDTARVFDRAAAR